MPFHYSKGGYSFRTDAGSLVIEPGPRPTALSPGELMQLGIEVRSDPQAPPVGAQGPHGVIDSILAALKESVSRCRGPEEIWMARDLKRAIVLLSGLDEETVRRTLGREGV
jgi:hypothetical protein